MITKQLLKLELTVCPQADGLYSLEIHTNKVDQSTQNLSRYDARRIIGETAKGLVDSFENL